MGKVKVGLYFDEELWKTFQKFVSVKRGKIYGVESEEAGKAIAAYMASDSEHAKTRKLARKILNFGRRSTETAELIGAKIDEMYLPGNQDKLERQHIEKAIATVLSPDPRNFRKYIPMLEQLGIIRHMGYGIYELPRREIKKEADGIIEAHRQAEVAR